MTRVAVLMPYYNHPDGLMRSLLSLCAEHEPFSLYLIDDGNIPPPQIDRSAYPFFVHIIHMPKNSGIVAALNTGLQQILADGIDFVARLDAGDEWVPGRLAAQRDFLLANPDYVWVGSRVIFIGAHGQDLFTFRYPETDAAIRSFVHINNPCCHPAVMFRSSAVRVAGYYSNNYPVAEDYEFFWRLLRIGKAANLPAPLLRYELNTLAPSVSTARRDLQLDSRLKIQLENFRFFNWLSWWGMLRTLMLLAVPYRFLWQIKSLFWRK